MHFISFEQYPLGADEIKRALAVWPDLSHLAASLAEAWSPLKGQPMKIELAENLTLTVLIGDANDLLPEQSFTADAWYLDGFSPAKNPQLWNESLMEEISRHTVAGGTFATYSAAGFVRRNLQSAAF